MKIIGSVEGECPAAVTDGQPCRVEATMEWRQTPDLYNDGPGQLLQAGMKDQRREHYRECLTHKVMFHDPQKEEWQ